MPTPTTIIKPNPRTPDMGNSGFVEKELLSDATDPIWIWELPDYFDDLAIFIKVTGTVAVRIYHTADPVAEVTAGTCDWHTTTLNDLTADASLALEPTISAIKVEIISGDGSANVCIRGK